MSMLMFISMSGCSAKNSTVAYTPFYIYYEADNGDEIGFAGDQFLSYVNAKSVPIKLPFNGKEICIREPMAFQNGPGSTGYYFLTLLVPVDVSQLSDDDITVLLYTLKGTERLGMVRQYDVNGYEISGMDDYMSVCTHYDKKQGIIYYAFVNKFYQGEIAYNGNKMRYVSEPFEDTFFYVSLNFSPKMTFYSRVDDGVKYTVAYNELSVSFRCKAHPPYKELSEMGDDFMTSLRSAIYSPKDNYRLQTFD